MAATDAIFRQIGAKVAFQVALALLLASAAWAQDSIATPRLATLEQASLVLAQGDPLGIANDSTAEFVSRLYSVLNAGDCYPASQTCSDDWYLVLGIGVAGAEARVWFLGQYGLVRAAWQPAPYGESHILRVVYQLPAKGVIPGTKGPERLQRVVTYSVSIDTLFRLPPE